MAGGPLADAVLSGHEHDRVPLHDTRQCECVRRSDAAEAGVHIPPFVRVLGSLEFDATLVRDRVRRSGMRRCNQASGRGHRGHERFLVGCRWSPIGDSHLFRLHCLHAVPPAGRSLDAQRAARLSLFDRVPSGAFLRPAVFEFIDVGGQ